MWDIARFDPGLGATLARLHAALVAHRAAGGAVSGPLLVDGVPLEDLCITFVLPGGCRRVAGVLVALNERCKVVTTSL